MPKGGGSKGGGSAGSRAGGRSGGARVTPMTQAAASRISSAQSHVTGSIPWESFPSRAQSAAATNVNSGVVSTPKH